MRKLRMANCLNRLARSGLVFLAILCFLVVCSVALAHGHSDFKSVDESHCAMCLAVHCATHAVATPIVTLYFAAIEKPFLVPSKSSLVAFAWPTLNQDRAPPSL